MNMSAIQQYKKLEADIRKAFKKKPYPSVMYDIFKAGYLAAVEDAADEAAKNAPEGAHCPNCGTAIDASSNRLCSDCVGEPPLCCICGTHTVAKEGDMCMACGHP